MNDVAQQQGGVPAAAHAAIEYRQAIGRVRGWCFLLAFFGGLAIYQGLQLMDAGVDIAIVGVGVGGILLLAAAAAGIRPSPATMVLEACAFGAIAAWDLFLFVLSGAAAAEFGIWGLVEVGIAVYLLAKLPGFFRIAAQKPSKEILQQLDAIVDGIRKAKLKEEDDLIEFAANSTMWRVRLSEDTAIFVEAKQGHDMLFVDRDELGIEDRTKPGKEAKSRPVTIATGTKTWQTKLSPEYLQRLVSWKEGPGTLPSDGSVVEA